MTDQVHTSQRFRLQTLRGALLLLPLISIGCRRNVVPEGQTVALVNGSPITTSDLQLELSQLAPDQRKQAQPAVMQSLVDRKVLIQYATSKNMDRSPDYILQARRADDILLAERGAQQIAANARQPVTLTDINRYLDSHPDVASNRRILVLNVVKFPMPSAAVVAELKPVKSMAELQAVLQRHGIEMKSSSNQVDTAALSDELAAELGKLQPGEPLIVFNRPNATASVIVDAKPMPISGTAAEDLARARILARQAANAVQQLGLSLRRQATISYAKGYDPRAQSNAPH